MRRTKYSTCKQTGKRTFRSEQEAERALAGAKSRAKSMRVKGQERKRREKRYYPCKHCSGFHLTSQPRRRAA